jgi:Heavy-metal resistance
MRARAITVALLLLIPAAAHAQQLPTGKWWRRPALVQELQLTNEQQDKFEEIFRNAANGLIDAKAEVDKLQIALRAEIDRPELRRQDIQRIAGKLSEARGRLFERELMMLVDMRGVLDETQWNRFREILDRLQDRGNRPNQQRPQPNRRRP